MLDLVMHVIAAVLVPLFYTGMAICALVVLVTLVRDIRDFNSKDEPAGQGNDGL